MIPGRELDALVAKHIFPDKFIKGTTYSFPGEIKWEYPPYSTDISAAWEVVEKATSDHWISLTMTCRPRQADAGDCWKGNDRYWVEITHGGQGAYPGPIIRANSVPHAICIAALIVYDNDFHKVALENNLISRDGNGWH